MMTGNRFNHNTMKKNNIGKNESCRGELLIKKQKTMKYYTIF